MSIVKKRSAVARIRAAVALGTGTALLLPAGIAMADEPEAEYSVLVFSKTAGFRHGSIGAGKDMITQLGEEHNFHVDLTEDSSDFTDENLADYDAVVWLSTTGTVLNAEQKLAFENYIQAGGGYAGIHAASDTEYEWDWYGGLVGAWFDSHPENQEVNLKTTDHVHPSTAHFPPAMDWFDELYNYRTNPRGQVHVLQELDEKSYSGGNMGTDDHPITWCQDYDGGRAWYTGLGHTDEAYEDPVFQQLILGGIETAAGVVPANCSATQSDNFEKVSLSENTSNPMDMAPSPDGRTFYIERDGRVMVVGENGGVKTAGRLDVTLVQEFGLVGIELDPNFIVNNWIYLYYSPDGSDSDRVSRFTLEGDVLDIDTEEVLLEVPVQRDECCHAGGALQFDSQGNLYIATGDNTNPFASDAYSPHDERPGREAWDAQRTSGNTNSLSGKVLRITPQDDGSYTVPSGNLFENADPDLTKPEIFAMGFRNPFKVGIDKRTDALLVADYGPDASTADPDRGPDGRVEWNIVDEPGNYGWPFCHGGESYNYYDFDTGQSGPKWDCDNLVNVSPNNTGLTELPPNVEPDIWYGYGTNPDFPEIGGGGAPMAGGVYHYDDGLDSERKWPEYWDNKAIFGEWNTNKMFSFDMTDPLHVTDIDEIFSEWTFKRPHAMRWGYDGALYVIEWGSGFGGDNADSGLYRIDYVSGDRSPIARLSADKTNGSLPLEVTFDGSNSRHPDGSDFTMAWDFGDGSPVVSGEEIVQHTYVDAGTYTAMLTVTDEFGKEAISSIEITAGNTAPTVDVQWPPQGGFFEWGDQIDYEIDVTDPEDGDIDCQEVVTQPALGHDEHAHPYDFYYGCEGRLVIPGDEGHAGANIFGVITMTYTDKGYGDAQPLRTQEVVVLQTKRKEAEYYSDTGRVGDHPEGDPGVQAEKTSDPLGGYSNVGHIELGDWFSFDPVSLVGIDSMSIRGASETGGSLEVRLGDPENGELVGSVDIPATGGWQEWDFFDIEIPDDVSTDSQSLYIINTGGQYNVNFVDFDGKGVTANMRPEVDVSADPESGPAPLPVNFTADATDPEGDEVTFEWNFGDGNHSTEQNPTHVYTAPGTYRSRVTVTDQGGAVNEESVEIRVSQQGMMCLDGRSDGFDGDELDHNRWDTIIRESQDLRVEDGHLVIPTSLTDIYGAGGDTPNIVLQDLPDGNFTATTKLTLDADRAYQQAGLIIYGDDDNYAKMVFQARDSNGDKGERIFQFIREEDAEPNEVADSNTESLGEDYPDTVWVQFTSDGENLNASYSANGVDFVEMPETKTLDGIEDPKIGILALASEDSEVVDAEFDWFHITPDDSLSWSGDVSDEFDGDSLETCRWDVVRPDPSALRVNDGFLEIDTSSGDIYGEDNSDPKNFVLQDQPEGDWIIETLVDAAGFSEQYQQGGLIVYADDDNYVKLDYLADNQAGDPLAARLEFRSEIDGVVQDPQPDLKDITDTTWYLRLEKSGSTFTAYYSLDGEEWTALGEPLQNADAAVNGRIGLFAFGAQQNESATARFDYFRLVGEEEAPVPSVAISTDPETADGTNGWFTGPVAVSVEIENRDDFGEDVTVYREVRINGGDWREYSAPVEITDDGEHVVEARASTLTRAASDVMELAVNIDSTPPTVIAEVDEAERTITLAAEDPVSGVATVEYQIMDGDWLAYEEPVAVGDEETTVAFRAIDNAGNVSDEESVTLTAADGEDDPEDPIDPEEPTDPEDPDGAGESGGEDGQDGRRPPNDSGALPRTGATIALYVGVALAFIALGAYLINRRMTARR